MARNKTRKKKIEGHSKKISVAIVTGILLVSLLFVVQRVTSPSSNVIDTQAAAQIAWPMFDGDAQKSGVNTSETIVTTNTVKSLKQLWQTTLPEASDGSPIYLSNVTTQQGFKNLIFITTEGGSLVAIDDATGTKVWQQDTQGSSGVITSSPVLDPGFQFVYSYGKDGKVHKYSVGSGSENTTGGWPFTATSIPNVEKGSSALTIGNGYLYVSISAYVGDNGNYVGHIAAKNLTTGATSVFNVLCSSTKQLLSGNCGSSQAGVWGRPGAIVDPVSGNVFISSGNGSYAPPNNLGDSVVELSPDLSKVIDTYTTNNFQTLDNADEDLGSTMPAMIPTQKTNPPNIAVQGGKDDKIRVLNRQNLSGQNAPYHVGGELQTLSVNCNIFSQPIGWVDGNGTTWVFVTDMCDSLYAYKVVNSKLQQVYEKDNIGRSSPFLVNNMLFLQKSGTVTALDPATGNVLWTGNVGSMHWQSPIVINGHVLVLTNDDKLTAFGTGISPTLSTPPMPTLLPSPTAPPITPTYYILQLGPPGTTKTP